MKQAVLRIGAAAVILALGVGLSLGGLNGRARSADLSPTEKLIAENDINQQIALYALLADGDGASGKNVRAIADRILMPNVVTEIYMADGKLASRTTSRDQMVAQTPPAPQDSPVGGRHFLVSTYFDSVTPTMAKTRTTTLFLQATKNHGQGCETMGPDACGGRVTHAVTLVYHDTWVKTADGWRKSESILRRDN